MSLSIFALAILTANVPKPVPILPAESNSYGKRVSTRRPNPDGTVLVLMYHHIAQDEKYMFRSEANFRKDLAALLKLDYRPVTIEEYVTGKMPLPPGTSPVVFTFDDGHRDQFNLLEDGSVDPKCFVGVWQDFAREHPEFPVHATFYVNDHPWAQAKWLAKKGEMLKSWGCEVGSHTMTHPNMKKLTDEQVMKEMAGAYDLVEKMGFEPHAFCYPFGNEPRNM
ncbi:MAG: polysaccharide deacetylase family protein, partial [Armatimonadota bacterium]